MKITAECSPYQLEAVEWACSREGACLFMEQGTGKTHVATAILERHMAEGLLTALLVVPLANLETTWVRTLTRVDGLTVCRTWEDFKGAKGRHRVLLLNYERIRPVITKLRKVAWSAAIYDESQRLKGRGSKQSKDAARLVDVAHRVILSGTPIEQAPQDLWGQFRFAVPDVLGRRWADFEAKWLKASGFMGYELKFRKELMPKFLKLIGPHILRLTKGEVLDIPPLRYHRVGVEMFGEQRRIYEDLSRDMMSTVDGREITCDLAITQLMRQSQVCGGFVRVDADEQDRVAKRKGRMVQIGRAKLRKLRALVKRERRRPLLVFCRYTEELGEIVKVLEELGLSTGIISGRQKKTRTATVEAFQRGELDALVCQIKAGGVGLDLQRACVAIFYSSTWSYIDFDQAVCRIHRRGQQNPCDVYLLFVINTVDSEVYEALLMKRSVTELILNRRKPMAKKTETPAKTKADATVTEKKKPTPPPQPPKPKYGVPELAEAMGVKASSIRVRLRGAKIPKAGKLYGWDTKAEMQEVIDALKAAKPKKEKAAPKKGKAAADEDEGDDEGDDE